MNNKPTPQDRLSGQESDRLLEQLSDGVAHGVSLEETFRALADDLTDRRLRSVAAFLAEQLRQGVDLDTALSTMRPVLPAHLQRALAAGARSGNLSALLSGLAESELVRRQMQRGLRAALAYPLLVLGLLGLLVLFLMVYVIPMFADVFDIYNDFNMELPAVTHFLLILAQGLPLAVLGVAAAGLVILVLGTLFAGKRFAHWLRTALPLFGRAWIWSGQHEFATLMATFTRESIPLSEALACTVESLRDRNLARATRLARERCEQGALLSQGMRESIHFDPALTTLVEWGETHQALPAALTEAARNFEQQMEYYIQFLGRVIPPLLLALVASVIFLMVVALILPLADIMNSWMW